MAAVGNTQIGTQFIWGNPPSPASKPAAAGTGRTGMAPQDNIPAKQPSLNEIIDDLMGKLDPLDKKIIDAEKEMRTHANVAADLQAAQAALENYLAEHPDRQGDIDTSRIMVDLPDTAASRTMSLYDLVEHYRTTQPELQLPAMPKIIPRTGPYENALERAVTMATSFMSEDKNSALTALVGRRQALLDLMGEIIKSYSELMRSMLRR